MVWGFFLGGLLPRAFAAPPKLCLSATAAAAGLTTFQPVREWLAPSSPKAKIEAVDLSSRLAEGCDAWIGPQLSDPRARPLARLDSERAPELVPVLIQNRAGGNSKVCVTTHPQSTSYRRLRSRLEARVPRAEVRFVGAIRAVWDALETEAAGLAIFPEAGLETARALGYPTWNWTTWERAPGVPHELFSLRTDLLGPLDRLGLWAMRLRSQDGSVLRFRPWVEEASREGR